MNPDRAAMIATTSLAREPLIQRTIGGGPKTTGMNKMPLGVRKPAGASQPLAGLELIGPLRPETQALIVKTESNSDRPLGL